MKAILLFLCLPGFCWPTHAQNNTSAKQSSEQYACLPCGNDCDHLVFDKPGTCPHCNMRLVLKKDIVFRNITPAQLCDIVAARPDVVLLDVRTPKEFSGKDHENFGHLKNAINIPVQDLESRLTELNAYRNKEIIVYCSHSHRSPRASQLLTENGFKNVKNMTGGMSVWADSVGNRALGKALLVK